MWRVVLIALMVVGLSGCGDDDGLDGEAPSTEESVESAPTSGPAPPSPAQPTSEPAPENVSFTLRIETDSGSVGMNIDDTGCAMAKTGAATDDVVEQPTYVVRDEVGTILGAGDVYGFAEESASLAFGLVTSTRDEPGGYSCRVEQPIFLEGAGGAEFLEVELTVGGQVVTEVAEQGASLVEVFVTS